MSLICVPSRRRGQPDLLGLWEIGELRELTKYRCNSFSETTKSLLRLYGIWYLRNEILQAFSSSCVGEEHEILAALVSRHDQTMDECLYIGVSEEEIDSIYHWTRRDCISPAIKS